MRLKVGVVLAECCDVPMTKCQRINATERREEHRFLGLVQHERIVHKTDAGLYVIWFLTRKTSPRSNHEAVYEAGVNVDANSAVAKIGNRPSQGCTGGLVALYVWRNEECGRQGSPHILTDFMTLCHGPCLWVVNGTVVSLAVVILKNTCPYRKASKRPCANLATLSGCYLFYDKPSA